MSGIRGMSDAGNIAVIEVGKKTSKMCCLLRRRFDVEPRTTG